MNDTTTKKAHCPRCGAGPLGVARNGRSSAQCKPCGIEFDDAYVTRSPVHHIMEGSVVALHREPARELLKTIEGERYLSQVEILARHFARLAGATILAGGEQPLGVTTPVPEETPERLDYPTLKSNEKGQLEIMLPGNALEQENKRLRSQVASLEGRLEEAKKNEAQAWAEHGLVMEKWGECLQLLIGLEKVLIWSNEHRGWWGPNSRGYTGKIENAGRYAPAEALEICAGANRFLKPNAIPNELPIRECDALELAKAEEVPSE